MNETSENRNGLRGFMFYKNEKAISKSSNCYTLRLGIKYCQMLEEINRIAKFWKEEYSDYVPIYSPYEASEQLKKFASFFAAGKSYFYILNLHNLQLDYLSPEVENFIDKPLADITIKDLLASVMPSEIESIEKKEAVMADFFNRYLDKEVRTDYKIIYSYKMQKSNGEERVMLHQATLLSLTENGKIQHTLSQHMDISHLKVISTTDISFISMNKNRKSYYNINPEKGIFDPAFTEFKEADLTLQLSDREKEIINQLAEGYSADEIAVSLNLSVHTIRTHRKNILQKSGCNNTAQLIAKCITAGVISLDHE